MTETEKSPPNDIAAEESLLGSILIDGEQMSKVELDITDFLDSNHQSIYKAILNLYKRGEGIDQITVAHELMNKGDLDKAGGVGYLSHLISITPTSIHAPYYAKVVKDCALNRSLITAGGQIAQLGYTNKDPIGSLSDSQRVLSSISKLMPATELLTPKELADIATVRYGELRDMQPGLLTGFSDFDRRTGGLFKGDYIVLAARPSVGKTTLALQIAENIAVKHNVLFISLEMTTNAISDKRIAWFIETPVGAIRRGNYDEKLLGDIVLSLGRMAEINLYLAHGPATTRSVRQVIERMKLSYGVDAVFIDYLSILRDRYGSNANERVGFISGELANMAKEFDIPIVVLSQLNRSPDARNDKRPQLSDLRESGSIEQDADLILFLYRDSYYNRNLDPSGVPCELIIAKDRLRGLIGKLELQWDGAREKYSDMTRGKL